MYIHRGEVIITRNAFDFYPIYSSAQCGGETSGGDEMISPVLVLVNGCHLDISPANISYSEHKHNFK